MCFAFWIFSSESNPTACNFKLQNETCLQYVMFLQGDQKSLFCTALYSPLIMALIVNKTKFVGTTTVASNDCIALLRNLKVNKTYSEFYYFKVTHQMESIIYKES